MNENGHNITQPIPPITRADLELARRGIPSPAVSPADIQAAYAPNAPGETRVYYPGDPGYALTLAEASSPEYEAEMDRYDQASRAEALAELGDPEPEADL